MSEESEKKDEPNGVQDYFNSVGINPNIARNDFGTKEALETFAKAGDELKKRKDNKDLITGILDKAWQIFKLMI